MKFNSGVLIIVLEQILRRRVTLDPELPLNILIWQVFTVAIGLMRGLLLTRRRLVLGRGARVRGKAMLYVAGGLVRIEEYCQVDCTSRNGIHLGRNFKLGAFSRMIASGTLADLGKGIRIGDNVGIGEFAYIGGAGGVEIGDDVIVGQYFSVHPENHVFTDLTRPIREQGVTREGINIGSNCWIGAKVTILDGVSLGRGCVVAAGSVVTHSFPDHAIIGGVPAKVLMMRGKTKHCSRSCNQGEKTDGN